MKAKTKQKKANILDTDKVFVIAEIGKNFIQSEDERQYEEYLANAKKLIDAAKEAGADAVKFQTHEVSDEQLNIPIVSPHFKGSDRYSWVKRNTEITPLKFWVELKAYADKKGIIFFSTAMSRKAAEKLESINVPLWKVGSGDVDDYVLLDYITKTGKPIIISTGMVSLDELDRVITHIQKRNVPLTVLYCVSEYPAPKEYFNLATIEYLKEKYPDVTIGFSDHSIGHDIALAAAKLGAKVIEKHFSLNRELWGSDHKVSMTPSEMKAMVEALRTNVHKKVSHEAYYGEKGRELEGATNKFRPYFKKTLVVAKDIQKGTVITSDMVYAMRPRMYSVGLPSDKFHDIVGRKIKKDLKGYDPITDEIFE